MKRNIETLYSAISIVEGPTRQPSQKNSRTQTSVKAQSHYTNDPDHIEVHENRPKASMEDHRARIDPRFLSSRPISVREP